MSNEELPERIGAAYQWILGREADEGGLSHYVGEIAAGRLDENDVREVMLNSAEFRRSYRPKQEVPFSGFRLIVNPQELEFGRHIVAHGEWETHVANTIRAVVREGDTFVDVGANIGVMSFHARHAVGPSGRVIAFEPNPDNADNFRRGLLANGFENVLLYQFALSDRAGMIAMSSTANSNVVEGEGPLGVNEIAQALIGDIVLAAEPRIDFIKMDIEGFEPFALKGLGATIAKHRPKMLIEFNPRCIEGIAHLEPAGFASQLYTVATRLEIIEGDGSRRPIVSPGALMEAWALKNRACVDDGLLADGMAHFDLLIET